MISDTAIVKDTQIGSGTKIWEFANLYGAKIGNDTMISSYVEIQNDVSIGNNVTVSSPSFICSLVSIDDNVFIRHGVMTINDLHPPSFHRTGSINHWKITHIKKGAVVGSNVTLLPVTIGVNAEFSASSVVTKDVPDNAIIAGNPARVIRIKPEE